MKTKEELNAIKEEVETVSKKLQELTDDELDQVFGGVEYQTIASNAKMLNLTDDNKSLVFGV